MLAEQLTQLRFARKLGVTTAVGTGAGSVGTPWRVDGRRDVSYLEGIYVGSAPSSGYRKNPLRTA